MHKLSKLAFLFSGISFICLILGRLAYGGWHHLLWIPLIFFLVLFIFPLAKEFRLFREFFGMKTTKRGLSMGSMILLMVGILVMANVIAVRKYKTWDFSAAKVNTLSEQSTQLLKGLTSDLKVIFFYKTGQEGVEENRRAFRELIKKYQDQSDRIRLDFVEVNERPDMANEYGVNKGGGIVFLEYEGRRNRIERIDEQEITSALLKVTREKDRVVYFVVGHGEFDLEEPREAQGAASLKSLLANNRYDVRTLTLATTPKIPDDADAVLVVGPQTNFLEHEVKALEAYLQRGGSLVLALESGKTGGLEKLTESVGIIPQNNYIFNVVETVMGRGVNQGPTVAPTFSSNSEITKVFGRNDMVVFRFPMALQKGEAPAGVSLDEIVQTLPQAMAMPDLRFRGEGPMAAFTLAMTARGRWPGAGDEAKEFRMAVFGNAQFMANALLYQSLNRDLVLNTVASMVREENMISITPKEPAVTKMAMTDSTLRFFIWGFVIPLPLLLLASSMGLWIRRRFA